MTAGAGETVRRVRGAAASDKVAFAHEQRRQPTQVEALLWEQLRGNALGAKFRRQHPIADFVADFYCESAQLAVEVDGPVHLGTHTYDTWRDAQLTRLGITTLRIAEADVRSGLEHVLRLIRDALDTSTSKG